MSQLAGIVMAAGLGTRMKSTRPKVLHQVLGRPMVFYAVDVALAAGCDRIVVVVGYGREVLEPTLLDAYRSTPLQFALQAEPRGTGHAVMCALEALADIEADLLVLNGDLPNLRAATVARLVAETRVAQSPMGFLTAHLPDPRGYGRVVRDATRRPVRVVEEADATHTERAIDEINVGTYLFESAFLRERLGALTIDNAQAELYLTDMVAQAAESGRFAFPVEAAEASEIGGVNSRADLAVAEAIARRRRNRELMDAGVTLIDPDRTIVEHGVAVESDVVLWPGVILQGETRVARGAVIEAGVVARDSVIGEQTRILPYSHLDGAVVGQRVQIGPFGRLRPGAVLDDGSKIGNFVEIKKSRLGAGAKANHLTYLGDSEVGPGANIGAGTITCNYDGRHKHATVIGAGAFIGSDTQLIAPVTVGDGAYVGAGTTVVQDVPADALAVSRASQRNIPGYAARKRRQWAEEDERQS